MNIKKAREDLKNGKTIYDLPLKVVYYARVSTDKDDQLNSLENQKNYFEEMILENKNWTFYKGYIDEGISGTSVKNRSNFLKMIKESQENKFDLILTKEISRFSRNTIDSIKYSEQLLTNGVIVYFITDNLNTIYEDSEFRLTIMSSLAQDEVRKLSQRVKFGINRMIKDRKIIGGNLTGYYKKDGKLIINPKEAFIIKYLFNSYVTGNYSLKKISTLLYEKGYKNTKGKPYSQATLAKILTNPRYKGYYTAHLTEVEDYKTHKKRVLPKEEQIIEKDDRIPSIISEKLWDEANNLYNKRKRGKSKNILNSQISLEKYKYSNLIFCKTCNKTFIRCAGSNRKNNPTWVCKTYKNQGIKCCNSPIIKESILDDIFIEIFSNIFTKEKLDMIINDFIKIVTLNRNPKEYKEEIGILENNKNKLIDLNLEGIISKEELKEKIEKINLKIKEFKNQKEENYKKEENIKKYLYEEISVNKLLNYLIKNFISKIEVQKVNENRNLINLYISFNYEIESIVKQIVLIK